MMLYAASDHHNAPAHLSQFVLHFSVKDEIAQVQQPPYPPHHALCNV